VDLTPNDLMREALRRAPAEALATTAHGWQTAARLGDRFVRRPGPTMSDAAAYMRSLRRMISGPPVEPSPLLRRRSLRRRLEVMEVGLDALKDASKSVGGSINDGFLAAVCGGVRLYHEQLGVPVESVPIAIPINVRAADDTSPGGNRWAAARFALPVGERDVTERIRRIRELVLEARNEPALNAMSLLAPIAARMPTWLLSAGLGGATATHDLQVSNVAGSRVPMYFAGAKVIKTFPFGPVPGPAAMITVYSYLRTLYVGINLDPAAITEPDLFTSCLQSGVDEILSLRPRRQRARRSR
jgi:WS/DGAT/MGAT family acyltransferase